MSIDCSVSPSAVPTSPWPLPSTSESKVYDTPGCFVLVCKILAQVLQFEPHDYQVEGVCAVLDGHDLLVTMATGNGKTGFYIMLMLAMHAISGNKTLSRGGKTFMKDPAMIIV